MRHKAFSGMIVIAAVSLFAVGAWAHHEKKTQMKPDMKTQMKPDMKMQMKPGMKMEMKPEMKMKPGMKMKMGMKMKPGMMMKPMATSGIFEGRGKVVAIVPAKGQIVMEHEEIKGFMKAMTMGYAVESKALLKGLNPGDAIKFKIDAAKKQIIAVERMKKGGSDY